MRGCFLYLHPQAPPEPGASLQSLRKTSLLGAGSEQGTAPASPRAFRAFTRSAHHRHGIPDWGHCSAARKPGLCLGGADPMGHAELQQLWENSP